MILSGDGPTISGTITQMAGDVRGLIKGAIELSYFTRGAIQYEAVLSMSAFERDILREFIDERLEIAKKSSHPIY